MINLTTFEQAVMEKLLQGTHPVLIEIKRQFDSCVVKNRELTGVGFYLDFVVSDSLLDSAINLRFGDVIADIDGLENGAGFVLYINNGKLDMLEGYSYDESWPDIIERYSLNYLNGQDRNWAELYKLLNPDTEKAGR